MGEKNVELGKESKGSFDSRGMDEICSKRITKGVLCAMLLTENMLE